MISDNPFKRLCFSLSRHCSTSTIRAPWTSAGSHHKFMRQYHCSVLLEDRTRAVPDKMKCTKTWSETHSSVASSATAPTQPMTRFHNKMHHHPTTKVLLKPRHGENRMASKEFFANTISARWQFGSELRCLNPPPAHTVASPLASWPSAASRASVKLIRLAQGCAALVTNLALRKKERGKIRKTARRLVPISLQTQQIHPAA